MAFVCSVTRRHPRTGFYETVLDSVLANPYEWSLELYRPSPTKVEVTSSCGLYKGKTGVVLTRGATETDFEWELWVSVWNVRN